MIEIRVLDPIWSEVEKEHVDFLRAAVSYKSQFYRQGAFNKVRTDYDKFLLAKNGRFGTGLVPRIVKFCEERSVEVKVTMPEGQQLLPYKVPVIKNFTLREDQHQLVQRALEIQRGILKAPTGSGKTVVGMHIIKAFAGLPTLFIVNAKGLLTQTVKELQQNGFKNIGVIGDGKCEPDLITVATIQTLKNMGPNEFLNQIRILLCDEAHHLSAESYRNVLSWTPAPVRIGLSATPPKDPESLLKMEEFLGPIIEDVTINDLKEAGILAKPTIKILKPPFSQGVDDLRKYADVYDKGIVLNRQRNKMIMDEAYQTVQKEEVVLILITKIEHGEELVRMASIMYPEMEVCFVQGRTDAKAREEIKELMEIGHKKCVIATAVFKEGINIRNINQLINACGGKSETALIQAIGRGLRTTATKTEVSIVDFCDISHRYLSQHSLERIWVYIENGWLS